MYDIESFRVYCLTKPCASESFPFDNSTLVFKVFDKMFALIFLENLELTVNLKCDPTLALDLRAQYPECTKAGYHMNKKHWNTVKPNDLPITLWKSLIDESYSLVVKSMTKKQQKSLGLI